MNEGLLTWMMGNINAELLEDEYMENDLQTIPPYFMEEVTKRDRQTFYHNTLKVLAGVTAGSLLAAGGVVLAIKLRKGSPMLPLIKK